MSGDLNILRKKNKWLVHISLSEIQSGEIRMKREYMAGYSFRDKRAYKEKAKAETIDYIRKHRFK